MIDKINKGIEQLQEFFDANFIRCDQESVEILLMLAYGHIFDTFTPHQLIQILGLDKNDVYDAINIRNVSRYIFWREKIILAKSRTKQK